MVGLLGWVVRPPRRDCNGGRPGRNRRLRRAGFAPQLGHCGTGGTWLPQCVQIMLGSSFRELGRRASSAPQARGDFAHDHEHHLPPDSRRRQSVRGSIGPRIANDVPGIFLCRGNRDDDMFCRTGLHAASSWPTRRSRSGSGATHRPRAFDCNTVLAPDWPDIQSNDASLSGTYRLVAVDGLVRRGDVDSLVGSGSSRLLSAAS